MKPISAPDFTELQQAAENAAKGIHDREAMRKACERMDRLRMALRKEHGEMNVAVELIREVRDTE
jgi:hypothetical protein